ncbi:MAG: hypothetical protein E7348_05685 [Clostridiales bacterium]|nr:hypothetical protein [Clostridiales bacterium]
MKKLKAKEVLELMISVLLRYLEEMKEFQDIDSEQFEYGERVAYVECLEYVQLWERSKEYGLDFDIEKKYPL